METDIALTCQGLGLERGRGQGGQTQSSYRDGRDLTENDSADDRQQDRAGVQGGDARPCGVRVWKRQGRVSVDLASAPL